MDLVEWGVPLVEWLQDRTWLRGPADAFSILGDVRFMIIWIPVVVWAIDHRLGRRLLIAMTAWGALNSLVKMAFAQPRPYWVEASIEPLASEGSFGFPSGHAAFAMVVWGGLALAVPRRWVQFLSAVMIVGIGASRVVLGVHWPADVIGGWILGALVLGLVVWIDGGRRPDVHALPAVHVGPVGTMTAGALASILPLALTVLAAERVGPLESEWLTLGGRGAEAIDPTGLVGAGVLCGGLIGTAIGSVTARIRGEDEPMAIPFGTAITRVLIGLTVVVVIAGGLGSLVVEGSRSSVPLAWLLGAAVTWWVLDGGPWVMRRLGLTGVTSEADSGTAS